MDEHAIVLRSARPPLAGIIAAWLDARASHSDETYRAYTHTLTSFRAALATLKPPLDLDDADPRAVRELLGGQMAAIDLTVEIIEDHMEARLAMLATAAQAWAKTTVAGESEPQPATHNRRLAIISSFYRYALNQGLLRGANPVTGVRCNPMPARGPFPWIILIAVSPPLTSTTWPACAITPSSRSACIPGAALPS